MDELAAPLSALLRRYIKILAGQKKLNIFEDTPLLVPVPLHIRRFNWRGFNQSQVLGQKLAEHFNFIADDILEKSGMSRPQAELAEKQERLTNVSGLFYCKSPEKVQGRTILLIDDVCTTGATLNECARVLKQNGATRVMALVVARG